MSEPLPNLEIGLDIGLSTGQDHALILAWSRPTGIQKDLLQEAGAARAKPTGRSCKTSQYKPDHSRSGPLTLLWSRWGNSLVAYADTLPLHTLDVASGGAR